MLKVTTIRITKELYDSLSKYAVEKDLSKNQVVKIALKKLLKLNDKESR